MEELLRAFSTPNVVFLILGFPVLAAILLIFYFGKKVERFSRIQTTSIKIQTRNHNQLAKILLLLVLSQNGEARKAKKIAQEMLTKDVDGDLDEEIAKL